MRRFSLIVASLLASVLLPASLQAQTITIPTDLVVGTVVNSSLSTMSPWVLVMFSAGLFITTIIGVYRLVRKLPRSIGR